MNNETAHEEPKTDVGSILRQRRMHRGQSLEAAHQQTRIPKKLLEALEANRIDAFPATVYLRGFLKNYCDYLDLDFEALWKQLFPVAQSGEEAGKKDASQPARATQDKLRAAAIALPFNESTLIPFVLLIALLAAGACLWLFKGGTPPAAASRPAAVPAAIAPMVPLNDLGLRLTAARDTLIRLKVDGTLRFEGRVPIGVTQDWKAKRDFSLRAADPADLRLELDGKEIHLSDFSPDAEGFRTLAR